MKFLDNFFENFLEEKFSECVKNGNYKITAAQWNARILSVNISIGFTIGLFYGISSILLLGILSLIINVEISGTLYFMLFVSGIVYAVYSGGKFYKIPSGSFGLIEILGEKKGKLGEKEWHLEEGDYRKIIDIPFYPNIFSAVTIPKKLGRFDFEFKGNKTAKDAIPWSGKNPALPIIVNPWLYANRIQSTSAEELRLFVEEIASEAIDSSFDEFSTDDLLMLDDASTDLKLNYYKVISQNSHCAKCTVSQHSTEFFNKKPLNPQVKFLRKNKDGVEEFEYSDNTFIIEDTGLAIRFLITESSPPTEVQQKYNNRSLSLLEKEIQITIAEGESEGIKLKGFATAEVKAKEEELLGVAKAAAKKASIKADREEYEQTFKMVSGLKDANDKTLSASEAKLTTELLVNAYAKENLIVLSGPDGNQLDDSVVGMITAFTGKLLSMDSGERSATLNNMTKKTK